VDRPRGEPLRRAPSGTRKGTWWRRSRISDRSRKNLAWQTPESFAVMMRDHRADESVVEAIAARSTPTGE
jgi:hypothetical protein